jgi:GTP-binding protein
MINRKGLARTSSEPGKTRQINFYNIDSKFYFVDLPGFGYSKMSHVEQEKVGKFIEEYLFTRKNIACIILLIDIRHKPSENDIMMFNYIRSIGAPHIVIASKADKIAPTKVDSYVQDLRNSLEANESDIILPFSSHYIFIKEVNNTFYPFCSNIPIIII